ncbi:MAG TPA: ABC transporter permease [Candidatus Polarisedimenticolia bacterium]|jgi:putative ABC transport system permease protein|nr:ABC transporter permease [Candidatus Polarisedimenticolia bacterium]
MIQDLRHALRVLGKSPGFALMIVLTLALGIGANTALFSILNGVLLRPLPYPHPDRLVMIWDDWSKRGGPEREWTNPATFYDWRDQGKSFESMAALNEWTPTLTGEGEPERLTGAVVTRGMLATLGVAPALGRDFLPAEDVPDAARAVLLSHGLWQRRFGGSPGILGAGLTLNGIPCTVIGVMPAGFRFPVVPGAELWSPMQAARTGRGNAVIRIVGRLKPGVTLERAQSEMSVVARRLADQYPDTNTGIGARIVPLRENFAREARRPLLVLLAAVGFVLLIACANVANLLLSKATGRHREMAIRRALGASRGRIVRQLLTENLVLGVLGGIAGLALSMWGVDLLRSGLPADLGAYFDVAPDLRVLGFTLLLSLGTSLVFGLAPALQASRPALAASMREGSLAAGETRSRARNTLVVAEVALSLMLLVGAGLLLKSFHSLLSTDAGLKPEGLLSLSLSLPDAKYPENPQVEAFFAGLLERMAAVPGIAGAAAISNLPFGGDNTDTSFRIEGRPEPAPGHRPSAWFSSITPDYLRVAGVKLLRGRGFDSRDTAQAPLVILINESMARQYWPNENPLGKRIGRTVWREVVGVVGNVRTFSLERDEPPTMYFPFAQVPSGRASILARLRGDVPAAAPALRAAVREADPDLAVTIAPMERVLSDTLAPRRWTLLLLASFAALAVVLAAVGIYGVMSYAVTRRTQEIGIRMALGARQPQILQLVLRQGLRLAAAGTALGLGLALALTRWMESLLYQVSATDPVTFAGIAALMLSVAAAACYLPARRASRVDPMIALRYE